jgi:hypothetical protein
MASGNFLYTVEQLKNALKTNGAKTDKFTIRFGTPAGDNSLILGVDGPLLCKSANFPEKDIGSADVWIQGRKLPLPGDTTYPESWEVEFYNTTDHKLRQMFITWMDKIDNYETNTHTCNPNMFMVDADVIQLACDGSVAAGYTFHNMYPSQIGQVEVNGETINSIQMFRVQFKFSHWTSLKV